MKLSDLASVRVMMSVLGSMLMAVIRDQIVVFRHPLHSVIGTSSPGPKLPNGALGWFFTVTDVTVSMFCIAWSCRWALTDIRAVVITV